MSDLFETTAHELKHQGINYYVTVPDSLTRPLFDLCQNDPFFSVVKACHEAEAVAIASGLYIGGAKSITVMENAGLFNAVEALRAMPVDMEIPLLLLVSHLGKIREDHSPEETLHMWFARGGSASTHNVQQGTMTEPILNVMGIPYTTLQTAEGVKQISWALQKAKEIKGPVAILLDTLDIWGL